MSTYRSLPALAVLLGLAACSSDEQQSVVSQGPYCPKPSIVADLNQTEMRAADGQVEWTARLANLASICDAREFDYTVEMDVVVDLRTGPAFRPGPVNLAYFVAVATPTGEVIDKQSFVVILEPGRNERRALRRETLRQRLPLSYQGERTTWSVLVGFEPTSQQVRDRTEEAPSVDIVPPSAPGSGQ
ncbi:MAG TPA: hypothetical protein VHL31_04420 [Geminicoccus sp.]|uniref:hypothetical protein n=1 Tax=Geminicoccus sp. TaxID=2024832 RepID=UPI002E302CCD|nr:hypothetical protein [Geminicoccus sp.]HEX2525534.1 hypothetical protein [Geminicoccus sp.]